MTLLEERPGNFSAARMSRLETPRLLLREPCSSDPSAVAALVNDRRIAENTTRIPHPYTAADAQAWLATVNRTPGEATYVVTLRNGDVIGACGVEPRGKDGPELGYWLGAAHWGKGYATEMARAVIDHAFTELQHDALYSGARISNPASRRVLEKCGFQWTGVGLYRIRAIASSAPIDRFRLDRKIWASLKSWGAANPAG